MDAAFREQQRVTSIPKHNETAATHSIIKLLGLCMQHSKHLNTSNGMSLTSNVADTLSLVYLYSFSFSALISTVLQHPGVSITFKPLVQHNTNIAIIVTQ